MTIPTPTNPTDRQRRAAVDALRAVERTVDLSERGQPIAFASPVSKADDLNSPITAVRERAERARAVGGIKMALGLSPSPVVKAKAKAKAVATKVPKGSVAVYNSRGHLVGICDPTDITPLKDAGEPDEAPPLGGGGSPAPQNGGGAQPPNPDAVAKRLAARAVRHDAERGTVRPRPAWEVGARARLAARERVVKSGAPLPRLTVGEVMIARHDLRMGGLTPALRTFYRSLIVGR